MPARLLAMVGHGTPFRTWGLGSLLLLCLGVLAALQFRWVDQVSEAERQRLDAQLRASAGRFAGDFDRELGRIFRHFFLPQAARGSEPLEKVEAAFLDRWHAFQLGSLYPGLVAGLLLVERTPDGGTGLRRLSPEQDGFEDAAWPGDLASLRPLFTGAASAGNLWSGRQRVRLWSAAEQASTLVLPLELASPRAFRERRGHGPWVAWALVRLDRDFVVEEFLPLLVRRHFSGPSGLDYDVLVRRKHESEDVIYRSEPHLDIGAPGDRTVDLFALRIFEGQRGPGPLGARPRRSPARGRLPPWTGGEPAEDPAPERWSALWQAVLIHRAGSLDEVVEENRRRNLTLGLGILLLLGTSALFLVLAAQRAQRLARQQTEFVAGLTHELHTPLAAIRSAAENLADGVISDPERVQRYGALIHRQGSRLSAMVAQALELAGMQAAEATAWDAPVDLGQVVTAAEEACEALLRERQVELVVRSDPDLPPLKGNPEALQQVVENLLGNAIKYGAQGARVELRVQDTHDGELELRVDDRGPGIPNEDLPHLFEPFYRGSSARRGRVDGSGLGLRLVKHIVERHGGSVEVEARRGGGSSFVVRLPHGGRSGDG